MIIMDNLFKLVDERVGKYMANVPYIIAVPCVVTELLGNEMVKVRVVANDAILTIPNWSGSSVTVGESAQLFYRGNTLTERNSYLGATINKASASASTYVQAEVATGSLLITDRKIAGISFGNTAENILLIFNAVVQGDISHQGNGTIKIFVDDEQLAYSPLVSTIISGNIHVSFTLPLTLSIGTHNIVIKGSGNYATLTSINACVWGAVAPAEPPFEPTGDDDYLFTTDSNNSYVQYYVGDSQYPSMPVKLDDLNIKTIEATAFNHTDVKSVYIPEGIQIIE